MTHPSSPRVVDILADLAIQDAVDGYLQGADQVAAHQLWVWERLNGCAPKACECSCHQEGRQMSVAHLVPCCDQPPAPTKIFGLELTDDSYADLDKALSRVTEAERRASADHPRTAHGDHTAAEVK